MRNEEGSVQNYMNLWLVCLTCLVLYLPESDIFTTEDLIFPDDNC